MDHRFVEEAAEFGGVPSRSAASRADQAVWSGFAPPSTRTPFSSTYRTKSASYKSSPIEFESGRMPGTSAATRSVLEHSPDRLSSVPAAPLQSATY